MRVTKKGMVNLREKIKKIRSRVNKRSEREIDLQKFLMEKLTIPELLLERWKKTGALEINGSQCTVTGMSNLITIVTERDYYLQFEPRIPSDHAKPIWHEEAAVN